MSNSQREQLSGSHVCEGGGETGVWSSNVTMEQGHLRTCTRNGQGAQEREQLPSWSEMSS